MSIGDRSIRALFRFFLMTLCFSIDLLLLPSLDFLRFCLYKSRILLYKKINSSATFHYIELPRDLNKRTIPWSLIEGSLELLLFAHVNKAIQVFISILLVIGVVSNLRKLFDSLFNAYLVVSFECIDFFPENCEISLKHLV